MRTRNPNYDRSRRQVEGATSPRRSGSRGITVRDGTTEAHPVVEMTFRGATITDGDDGTVVVEFDESSLLNQDLLVDHGNMGATETLSMGVGTWHRGTLNTDCTITVDGYETGSGLVAVVEIEQNGTGGYAITWDSDITWFGDDQPIQAATAQSTYVLWSSSGDSEIYGARVGSVSGASASDSSIWRPVMSFDGTNWNVLVGGSGDAIMAFGPA